METEENIVEVPEDTQETIEDDGVEDYGERVQKRISKEVRKRHELENQMLEEKRKREDVENKLREYESVMNHASDEALKARHSHTKNKLKQAFDAGDTDLLAEAQDELSDVRARMVAQEIQSRQRYHEPVQNKMSQSAENWLNRNQWFRKPENSRYASMAHAIESELVSKGYKYNDDLYDELDKLLEDEVPKIKNLRGGKNPSMPAPGRWGEGDESRKVSSTLTREDLVSMKRYGFDPDSIQDRKAWIERNKI